MQKTAPFKNWLSDPRNKQVAELIWLIKNTEAKFQLLLNPKKKDVSNHQLITELHYCKSLYQELSQYYPPIETPLINDSNYQYDTEEIFYIWLDRSNQLMQSSSCDEKAQNITIILDYLTKLILFLQQNSASIPLHTYDHSLTLEQLSSWFLSLIDLIRHQQDNSAWAHDFFQKLSTSAYHELYRMLTHSETAHLMFHIYYYKLFPDQLSKHSKHPDFLISIDQRLSFLYQKIEQFVETFILYSKNHYQVTTINFLCHGNQLPKGITLRSKEAYRQLIIQGLKKLNRKVTITSQTPTSEIIDAIIRSYQFWFNPQRILDALFMLCKSLNLPIEDNLDKRLYNHMLSAFLALDTDICIHLYGYFSNNDTRYLLRVLDFVSHGGEIEQLPTLSSDDQLLIKFLYQSFSQIIDALSESLNSRNLPCSAIRITQTAKPPTPSKRNLQAILHVIATYGNVTEVDTNLEDLFAELETDEN